MDYGFLKSTRFWLLVVGVIVTYLKAKGLVGMAETVAIDSLVTGFIAIRTVDRAGEKIGQK